MASSDKSKGQFGKIEQDLRAFLHVGSWWEALLIVAVLIATIACIAYTFTRGSAPIVPFWFGCVVFGLGFLGVIHQHRAGGGGKS
ncbi:MAG: hypothetical protein L0216_01810 [Planctomycetales bacterium]|nr:hypothetical protein [Planctomycetales bacterium]